MSTHGIDASNSCTLFGGKTHSPVHTGIFTGAQGCAALSCKVVMSHSGQPRKFALAGAICHALDRGGGRCAVARGTLAR